jgi:DNA-binding transcriptional MerR regulator
MATNKISKSPTYKIGAVSRMTGIAPDTLRIWERRYAIVTPERTPAGGRLYSQEQISRLALIKNLVDAGDSISSVAGLGLEELQNRLTRSMQTQAVMPANISGRVCRLAILGESLKQNIENATEPMDSVEVIGSFTEVTKFATAIQSLKPNMLLVEVPTLHEDSANRVIEWLQLSGAMHAILVYRFGNTESFRRLPKSKCSLMRAPVDPLTIQRLCQSLLGTLMRQDDHDLQPLSFIGEMAAPRKYDDETLARVAMQSTVIKCECPRHLTELITSLSAFERYSTECESRSPEDAALHTYLNATASRARMMIENALAKVIETENIEV